MVELTKNKRLFNNKLVLMTYKQASDRYSLSVSKVTELAKTGEALVKIGKSARIDVQKMDDFLLSFRG